MDKNKVVISLLIVLLVVSIVTSFALYQKAQKSANFQISGANTQQIDTQSVNNITYTTFSSPKLDFTFEYPSTWKYEDISDQNSLGTTDFVFYDIYDDKIPILKVESPMNDAKDFCSGKNAGRVNIWPYMQLNIFPTNDPETFVTYEQCGQRPIVSGAIIYWQKGEKFLSTDDVKDVYTINTMLFNPAGNFQKDKEVGLYIAQSVRIK